MDDKAKEALGAHQGAEGKNKEGRTLQMEANVQEETAQDDREAS
jgi:hypothetical protein